MKIAIIADWLTNQGGAEKVVYDIHKAFPDAPIYTSIYNQEKLPQFAKANVKTSFLQNLPIAKSKHQLYLGLMPYAFESFDLSQYDVVISSCFACSKGIITKPETTHICYCHNPMRYVWDESHQYVKEHTFSGLLKFFARPILHRIRIWDRLAADRVDKYIANSNYVATRIKKYYQRESTVIHPGIDLAATSPNFDQYKREDFYLCVGRLKTFKRVDLVIETFNKYGGKLLIVGEGEDRARLESLNKNPDTKFMGFVSETELQKLYLQAKALIFPQNEDFGITPIEAQFYGCPVIAYNKGGALETISDKVSGLFFDNQTPEGLHQAIQTSSKTTWKPHKIHENALKFSSNRFVQQIKDYVAALPQE